MPDNAAVNSGSGLGVATDEILVALTGTVAKTNGSATLTGTGTAFTTELSVGMVISVPGGATERAIVSAIASDTSLTVTANFANTSSGQTASRVIHVQYMKLMDGTADSVLPIKIGQQTKANSLAIVLPSDYQAPIVPTNSTPTLTSVSSNNADMLAATDVSNYRVGALALTGTFSAQVSAQISNDGGTTWSSLRLLNNGAFVSTANNTNNTYFFNIPAGAQLRVRTTSYSSGTVAGTLALSSAPGPAHDQLVALALTSSSGDGNLGFSLADFSGNFRPLMVGSSIFNNSTWDRQRGVNALSLLTSAARTTTTDSPDQTNYNWRGLILNVNVTSAGTGSITPSIQVKDSISNTYKTIWTAAAALTANGNYVYALYPGAGAASFTEAVSILLSRTWRVEVVANNANSVTYSVSADMQL